MAEIIDPEKLFTFYETPIFSLRLADFVGDNALPMLYAIQHDLLAAPDRYPMVKGLKGVRKGRIAEPKSDKGKSGSYRYLYLYLELRGQIYLLWLFSKSQQADLNDEQRKLVAGFAEAIKKAKS